MNVLEKEIEYIDMYQLREDFKAEIEGTEEEKEAKAAEKLRNGLLVKGFVVNTIPLDFYNPMSDKKYVWYYLECPRCKTRSRRLYFDGEVLICRKCRIKNPSDICSVNDNQGRIKKIFHYLETMNDPTTSFKRKKMCISKIFKYYNQIDSEYRPQATVLLKSLQKWCEKSISKSKSPDYKKALEDVLQRLEYLRVVFIKTKLIKKADWSEPVLAGDFYNTVHKLDG